MKLLPIILEGTANKVFNVVNVWCPKKNPTLLINSYGNTRVLSVVGGVKHEDVYTSTYTSLSVLADPNTKISIIGDVDFGFSSQTDLNMETLQVHSSYIQQISAGGYGIAATTLTSLDVMNCNNLQTIRLALQNYLSEVVLNNKNAIEELSFPDCVSLRSLDVTKALLLKTLDVTRCKLIDIIGYDDIPALENLTISQTNISTLPKNVQALKKIVAQYYNNATLDVSSCANLEEIDLESSTIITLDLSQNTKLKTVLLRNAEALTSCVFPETGTLTRVDLRGLEAEVLDLSNCTGLETVFFGNGSVKKLDLSGTTVLTTFSDGGIPENSLQELRIRALDFSVASSAANFINYSSESNGVVYLNSADTYYSTIADAATEKGWTIEPLA